MQFLRNVVWWMLGLTYVAAFGLSLAVGDLLGGVTAPIQSFALGVVGVGLGLGVLNRTRVLQAADTFTHEVGHAQVAALLFRKITFIKTSRDSSGVTYYQNVGPFRRLGEGLISAAGPIASATLFAFTARLTTLGMTSYWLAFISCAALLVTLTTLRNFWGVLVGFAVAGGFGYLWFIGYRLTLKAIPFEDLSSNVSLPMLVVLAAIAFNSGVALRYSWQARRRRPPQTDEYRFGAAFFMGPSLGGHLLVFIELILIALGFMFLVGIDSPMALIGVQL